MQQVSSTDVQNILRNMRYPASKQQIIDEAIKQDTNNEALLTFENIPNKIYNNSAEVIDEFEDFQKAVQVFHNRKYPASKQELEMKLKTFTSGA